MGTLAEAQARTEEQLGRLTETQGRTGEQLEQMAHQVERLVEVQLRMGTDLERLKGSDLERRYRERGHAYFSRVVRRAHVLSGDEVDCSPRPSGDTGAVIRGGG